MDRFWKFVVFFAGFQLMTYDVPWAVYYFNDDFSERIAHETFLDLNAPRPQDVPSQAISIFELP